MDIFMQIDDTKSEILSPKPEPQGLWDPAPRSRQLSCRLCLGLAVLTVDLGVVSIGTILTSKHEAASDLWGSDFRALEYKTENNPNCDEKSVPRSHQARSPGTKEHHACSCVRSPGFAYFPYSIP